MRPNFFMQNLSTTYAAQIRDTGDIVVPAGRSRTAFIDARDIGKVAAAVFTSAAHLRRAHTLSSEQSLTYLNVAQIMTGVLGRPIRYTRPSEADYLASLAAHGAPEDYIAVQKMIYRVAGHNLRGVRAGSPPRLGTGRDAGPGGTVNAGRVVVTGATGQIGRSLTDEEPAAILALGSSA